MMRTVLLLLCLVVADTNVVQHIVVVQEIDRLTRAHEQEGRDEGLLLLVH